MSIGKVEEENEAEAGKDFRKEFHEQSPSTPVDSERSLRESVGMHPAMLRGVFIGIEGGKLVSMIFQLSEYEQLLLRRIDDMAIRQRRITSVN